MNTGQSGEPYETKFKCPQRGQKQPHFATLKNQISKIDSFTKKLESAVRASISQIRVVVYAFIQLRQQIEHLKNMDNYRYGREDGRLLVKPQWIGGSQYKEETPISHT